MVIPVDDEPQFFCDDSEDEESEEESEDSGEDPDDEAVETDDSDDEPDDESGDEPPIDPIILEARAKLEEATRSGAPITDPELIRTLFGRC